MNSLESREQNVYDDGSNYAHVVIQHDIVYKCLKFTIMFGTTV